MAILSLFVSIFLISHDLCADETWRLRSNHVITVAKKQLKHEVLTAYQTCHLQIRNGHFPSKCYEFLDIKKHKLKMEGDISIRETQIDLICQKNLANIVDMGILERIPSKYLSSKCKYHLGERKKDLHYISI